MRRHVVQVLRSDGFAGVERYVVDVSDELARRGWQVTVIGGDSARMRAELPAGVEWRGGTTIAEVGRALWSADAADIVHAHMTAAELPAALLRRRQRLVVTRHFAAPRGSSGPARIVGRYIARRVDVQLAISEFVARSVEDACTVVPNGVAMSASSHGERRRTVIVVQRLEVEKDTGTALRAWAASGLGSRGWTMDLCGRGVQAGELERLACALGIADSVRFVGFVDDPRERLATASILLATAPAEPFGLAVVEAMAEGTPVVAADGGAHRETLGPDGAFFAPGDAAAAATELRRLADAPDERRRRGELLRDRQRAMFTVAAHVDRLELVYRG